MKTRDIDIRDILHRELDKEFAYDIDTLIIDELGVCQGEARIDIAVVNGSLHGYEIKSDKDTLGRLPGQIETYNRVFDTVTIVTGSEHLDKVFSLVPGWWGISLATYVDSLDLFLQPVRNPQINDNVDAFSLTQFLWREELLHLVQRYELDKKVNKLPRFKIWDLLAEIVPVSELKVYVRACLKKRQNWRPGVQRTLNGD
ncbi:sce7726 family protein [Desulfosporosinus lacus]|uniref:Sce7726 family protein n=1 Tax=Desulfosporosinus lacus DSM 15449 TaxID=1121420 RepID=A0A1M6BCD9_9FIRM|nr:sce7726 family protein [Desulfosporosinus lacus]SHI46113.1 hypothetical protein SAMN02746098_04137 [Desulfosporosinus lacus DSM 15449]